MGGTRYPWGGTQALWYYPKVQGRGSGSGLGLEVDPEGMDDF